MWGCGPTASACRSLSFRTLKTQAHPLPSMLDELLGAQLDAADGAAPPMDESLRRAAAHGSTLVRPKPYDVWV